MLVDIARQWRIDWDCRAIYKALIDNPTLCEEGMSGLPYELSKRGLINGALCLKYGTGVFWDKTVKTMPAWGPNPAGRIGHRKIIELIPESEIPEYGKPWSSPSFTHTATPVLTNNLKPFRKLNIDIDDLHFWCLCVHRVLADRTDKSVFSCAKYNVISYIDGLLNLSSDIQHAVIHYGAGIFFSISEISEPTREYGPILEVVRPVDRVPANSKDLLRSAVPESIVRSSAADLMRKAAESIEQYISKEVGVRSSTELNAKDSEIIKLKAEIEDLNHTIQNQEESIKALKEVEAKVFGLEYMVKNLSESVEPITNAEAVPEEISRHSITDRTVLYSHRVRSDDLTLIVLEGGSTLREGDKVNLECTSIVNEDFDEQAARLKGVQAILQEYGSIPSHERVAATYMMEF